MMFDESIVPDRSPCGPSVASLSQLRANSFAVEAVHSSIEQGRTRREAAFCKPRRDRTALLLNGTIDQEVEGPARYKTAVREWAACSYARLMIGSSRIG